LHQTKVISQSEVFKYAQLGDIDYKFTKNLVPIWCTTFLREVNHYNCFGSFKMDDFYLPELPSTEKPSQQCKTHTPVVFLHHSGESNPKWVFVTNTLLAAAGMMCFFTCATCSPYSTAATAPHASRFLVHCPQQQGCITVAATLPNLKMSVRTRPIFRIYSYNHTDPQFDNAPSHPTCTIFIN